MLSEIMTIESLSRPKRTAMDLIGISISITLLYAILIMPFMENGVC